MALLSFLFGVRDKEEFGAKLWVDLEAETIKKPSSNRSIKDRRNTLFRVLDGV